MEVSHFMLSKKVSGMLAGNAHRIFCDSVTCFGTKKAPGRLPLHSDCVENTEARCSNLFADWYDPLRSETTGQLPLSWQIRGFPAPRLRQLSWHTPEVLVHEEIFQDKTGAIAMAILRGDIPMMAFIPTNEWFYCLHMCRLHEVLFRKQFTECL